MLLNRTHASHHHHLTQAEVAALEASELALRKEQEAAEEASARQEVERLKAQLAAAEQAHARNKRPAPGAIPTSPRGNKRPKPSTAEIDEEQAQIDLLSSLHNQVDSDEDEPMEDGDQGGSDKGDEATKKGDGEVGPEDEEAWQRAVAAEMGIEYVHPDERIRREKEAIETAKREEQEAVARQEDEARKALFASGPLPAGKVEMTVEEGRALFKVGHNRLYPALRFCQCSI